MEFEFGSDGYRHAFEIAPPEDSAARQEIVAVDIPVIAEIEIIKAQEGLQKEI